MIDTMQLYWNQDIAGIEAIRRMTSKKMDGHILISESVVKSLNLGSYYTYFDVEVPEYQEIYVTASGSVVSKADLRPSEIGKMLEKGCCVRIEMPSGHFIKVKVTLYGGNCVEEIKKKAFIRIEEAIEHCKDVVSAPNGESISLEGIKNAINMEDADYLNRAITLIRMYAKRRGALDLLQPSISEDAIERVGAALDANYVHTLLR